MTSHTDKEIENECRAAERSRAQGHPDDRGLVFALEELSFFSKELTILGVYPAHPFRETFEEVKA